jgi:hypothetical protein
LLWNWELSPSLNLFTSAVSSHYAYTVEGRQPTNEFDWNAGVDFQSIKTDASFMITQQQSFSIGVGVDWYKVNPGQLHPLTDSNINPFLMANGHGQVFYAYFSHQWEVSEKVSLLTGFRYSIFNLKGPGNINRYASGLPRSGITYTRSDEFRSGDKIQEYNGYEPRVCLRFGINKRSSVKMAFDQTIQYLHLISNTSAVSPVDVLKLSDPYLKPETGQQYSAGYFRTLGDLFCNFSAEVFYKRMNNVVDYKDGAVLLLNDRLEASLLQGEARAYGIEWMIEKKQGSLTGWLAYTLSRTERKFESEFETETINRGDYFPADYDKPHNLSLTISYEKSKRIAYGMNFIFSTGRPISYPVGSYNFNGIRVANFEERNNERTPAYHRLDLSMEIHSREKPGRKWKSSWVFSLYNAYARKNPYSIFFRSDHGIVAESFRLAVIGTVIPSISYSINF